MREMRENMYCAKISMFTVTTVQVSDVIDSSVITCCQLQRQVYNVIQCKIFVLTFFEIFYEYLGEKEKLYSLS